MMNSVISGSTMLLLCGLSTALECDRTRQYPVESKGNVKTCIDCRACSPGYSPRVPCGKIIDASVSVGDCDPCKKGTYSSKKDFKACQDCLYKKCFDHQVVNGTCTDKNDMSRCTDKCEEGYSMNKGGTECDIDLARQNKTTKLATKTTSNPPTSPTTTRNTSKLVVLHDRKDTKESKLASGDIAGIVCAVIVIVIVIIFISICWYKSRNTERGDKDDKESQVSAAELLDKPDHARGNVKFSKQDTKKNDSANTSSTTLDEIKDEVTGPFSQQEKCQRDNDSLTSDCRPQQETTQGFVDSSQSNNAENEDSDTVVSYTPPLTDNLLEPVVQNRQHGLSEQLITQSAPAAMAPNCLQVNNPHLTRFGGLSCETYNKLCLKFDAGTAGIGWRNLAGWLGLKVEDVEPIEITENKTSQVIQRWSMATENTVSKFVKILEKHGVTYFADKIRTELNIAA